MHVLIAQIFVQFNAVKPIIQGRMKNPKNSANDLLTIPDVMKIFGISRRTVYNWVDQGTLRPSGERRVYRFLPEEIEELSRQKGKKFRAKKSILSIDDDLLVRASIKPLLERFEFKVTAVASGKEAVERASKTDFDLIITDLRMPGMDGLSALEAIREERKKLARPPIKEIVLTAYDDTEPKEKSKQLGVHAFMLKPFDLKDFLATVRKIIHAE